MAYRTIHKGDKGVVLVVTFYDEDGDALDVSSATTIEMHFKKPDGETAVVTAAYVSDGSDGQLEYTTLAATLDQAGTWQYQGYIVTAALDIVSVRDEIVVQDRIV